MTFQQWFDFLTQLAIMLGGFSLFGAFCLLIILASMDRMDNWRRRRDDRKRALR